MYTLVHYMHPVLVDQYQITTNNSDSGFISSLCLEPWAKHKNDTTIETWLSNFHVFVGPYTKQFPHEGPALMKFGEIIQDLAMKGHKENFRFLRHPHHLALLWDQIHGELWLKSQVSQHWPLQNSANPPKREADFVPKGYLIRIASVFLVVRFCYRCEGSHSISKFNFRGSSKIASSQQQPAKSSSSAPQHPNSSKSWGTPL